MRYLIGIQPTGKLHIGNYLGCIRKGLQLQNNGHDVIFLIANYHSLTTDTYSDVTKNELKMLGCKNIVEQTPEYTELFFKICCKLNLGSLLKMPQYKDKKDAVEYDLGLLLYPALMTADIIINDPDIVIIGEDQAAHLELCNDIAKRVNGRDKYGYEFGDVNKIMSLQDPTKKMSKSLGEKHVLYLFEENYAMKLRKANMNEQGLENIGVIANFFGLDAKEYTGNNGKLKQDLAIALEKYFKPEFATN